MDEAVALTKELLKVPDTHEVIFLQGGASMQFAMVAYNLLTKNGKAQYLDTGAWASKAFKEADGMGQAEVIASSNQAITIIFLKTMSLMKMQIIFIAPNTIYGTQIKNFPNTRVPVVCDMSSDIFQEP